MNMTEVVADYRKRNKFNVFVAIRIWGSGCIGQGMGFSPFQECQGKPQNHMIHY